MADQVLLPPPTHIGRFDKEGKPTKAQVEYDTRLGSFVDVTMKEGIGFKQRIEVMEVAIGDSSAGIIHELTVLADGQTAMSQDVETLTAAVGTTNASVQTQLTALATADTAMASDITTLNANVGDVAGQITSERSLRISGDVALGTRIDNLVLTSGNSAAVIIDEEATARIEADYVEATKRLNLSAYVGYTDGQSYSKTLAASISDESSARVEADKVVAQKVTYLGAGTNRVFVQTDPPAGGSTNKPIYQETQPSTTGRTIGDIWYDTDDGRRQYVWAPSTIGATDYAWRDNSGLQFNTYIGRIVGDVWYDSNDNFKPYVWCPSTANGTDYTWRDNSQGAYTSYIGQFATIKQQFVTIYDPTNSTSLAYQIVQVNAKATHQRAYRQDDAPTGAELVTGDIWYDTNDKNKLYFYNGTSWVASSDTRIETIPTVYRQTSQPTGNVVGDLWFDTSVDPTTGKVKNAPYYWTGSAWQAIPDNTRASQADVTTEQSARVTGDKAVAVAAVTASAGTGRVYTIDPGPYSRENGDVWLKPEENFKPYVWYGGAWRDNSNGEWSVYVGALASVSQIATAAQNSANDLSYEWRIQGTIDGQPAGSIRLTGAKRIDETNDEVQTRTKILLDSDYVEINGNLLVGKVDTNQLVNGAVKTVKIQDGAITAGKIDVSDLSAITANLGTINAGIAQSKKLTSSGDPYMKITFGDDNTFPSIVISD